MSDRQSVASDPQGTHVYSLVHCVDKADGLCLEAMGLGGITQRRGSGWCEGVCAESQQLTPAASLMNPSRTTVLGWWSRVDRGAMHGGRVGWSAVHRGRGLMIDRSAVGWGLVDRSTIDRGLMNRRAVHRTLIDRSAVHRSLMDRRTVHRTLIARTTVWRTNHDWTTVVRGAVATVRTHHRSVIANA